MLDDGAPFRRASREIYQANSSANGSSGVGVIYVTLGASFAHALAHCLRALPRFFYDAPFLFSSLRFTSIAGKLIASASTPINQPSRPLVVK